MIYGGQSGLLVACVMAAALLAACGPVVRDGSVAGASSNELAGAAGRGDTAEVDRLVAAGAPLDEPLVLQAAVMHRQHGMIRHLVTQGAPVNGTGTLQSPLWFAVTHGDIHLAELLIDLGADVNWQTSQLGTPLHAAAHSGPANEHRVALADLLLEHGARINAIQRDPMLRAECLATALHAAVAGLDQLMVEFLLARGARLDVTDAQGRTPGQCAEARLQQGQAEDMRRDIERMIGLLDVASVR
jgi:ankyrin repeat protein